MEKPSSSKLQAYISLTRFDRPIGTLLLLWPTLWALWIAADGIPDLKILIIFVLGTLLTRSAGCAINDYADREIDLHVSRTKERPLATGEISPREAVIVALILMALAFLLVLFTNKQTILMSFGGLFLAFLYPFTKRFTHLPQVFLGAAFAWAVPMAFTAQTGTVTGVTWLIYFAALLWAVAYDTIYAMADREDDLKLGVKSSAILFGKADLTVIAIVEIIVLSLLVLVGLKESFSVIYYIGLLLALGLLTQQLWSVRGREPENCMIAFLNNNYVGMIIFIAIVIEYI